MVPLYRPEEAGLGSGVVLTFLSLVQNSLSNNSAFFILGRFRSSARPGARSTTVTVTEGLD